MSEAPLYGRVVLGTREQCYFVHRYCPHLNGFWVQDSGFGFKTRVLGSGLGFWVQDWSFGFRTRVLGSGLGF